MAKPILPSPELQAALCELLGLENPKELIADGE